MSVFYLKAGDQRPYLDYVLTDDLVPVDLTAATTVVARFQLTSGGVVTSIAASVTNAVNGAVRITWTTGLPASTAGVYQMETSVTWGDGTVETWPNRNLANAYDELVVTSILN